MNKLKEINVIVIIVITLIFLPTTYCQYSGTSTLNTITNGIKAMFGFDHILKTYRKISSGFIPFPLFVPILPKSKFVELLRGKRYKTEDKSLQLSVIKTCQTFSLFQQTIGEESKPSSCQLDPIAVPPPASFIQKLRPTLTNHNFQKLNEYPFYNMRPIKISSDYPIVLTNSLTDQIQEGVRPNGLDFNDLPNGEESDSYSERYESEIGQELEKDTIEPHSIPTPLQVVQNWDTIDDELRRIGYQLGKLGTILHRD